MKKIVLKFILCIYKRLITIFKGIKLKIQPEIAKKQINEKFIPSELWNEEKLILKIEEQYMLSLIVPVYNVEKYLQKCIDSLINQTTKYKYEIIFINDGSTDNCLNILKEAEQYDFVKIINQKNGGLSIARNVGINNAKGKYIGFIDSDDYISETYIEKLLSTAIRGKC